MQVSIDLGVHISYNTVVEHLSERRKRMLKFLRERQNDYNANSFINELFEASKILGVLEAKISGYHFDQILIPLLHKREAQSTMYIEGTQTTISDVFEDEIRTQPNNDKVIVEFNNHTRSILYGSD